MKTTPPAEMKLCLPTENGFKIVQLQEILYCKGTGNQTMFTFSHNRTMLVTRTLLDCEKALSGTGFFRIHRSFLVNFMHVKEYQRGKGGSVIMSDGTGLLVSNDKKEQFIQHAKGSFQ